MATDPTRAGTIPAILAVGGGAWDDYTLAWDAEGLTVYCDSCDDPIMEVVDDCTVEHAAILARIKAHEEIC